jgi:Aspartyl protease
VIEQNKYEQPTLRITIKTKMKTLFLSLSLLFLSLTGILGQKALPILKTNTPEITIKEGESVYNNVWTISPEVKPDIFVTNPFEGTKKIVFYSDIDSISFTVKPNKKYDFVILQNGKEKAFTQINTDIKEEPSLEPKLAYRRRNNTNQEADTIHFTLGKDHGIHLKGRVNQSDTLDFLFDTGANACVITSSLVNTKVKLVIDGSQKNGGTDGVKMASASSKNTLETGNLIWDHVSLLSIDYKNPSFDIVLGWIAFEGKIVEIDYEKCILIIHQRLPQLVKDYTKLDFKYMEGLPYINVKFVVDGHESEAWFDFDTGSNGTLAIGQKLAKQHPHLNNLKKIGTSESVGSTGIPIKNKEVLLPKMKLGDYEMYQIPLSIQERDVEDVEHNENIGNKS